MDEMPLDCSGEFCCAVAGGGGRGGGGGARSAEDEIEIGGEVKESRDSKSMADGCCWLLALETPEMDG